MSKYEEGLKAIDNVCGNNKDNVISLSTISTDLSINGQPQPCTRDVDAYYEDGVFYVTTWGESNKMRQIAQNNAVAFSVNFEGIYGVGVGENLGWVLDPKNAELRQKLRTTFAAWYDVANNEENENCVILAIRMTKVTVNIDHGAVYYALDFVNKVEG